MTNVQKNGLNLESGTKEVQQQPNLCYFLECIEHNDFLKNQFQPV